MVEYISQVTSKYSHELSNAPVYNRRILCRTSDFVKLKLDSSSILYIVTIFLGQALNMAHQQTLFRLKTNVDSAHTSLMQADEYLERKKKKNAKQAKLEIRTKAVNLNFTFLTLYMSCNDLLLRVLTGYRFHYVDHFGSDPWAVHSRPLSNLPM